MMLQWTPMARYPRSLARQRCISSLKDTHNGYDASLPRNYAILLLLNTLPYMFPCCWTLY